MRTTVLIGGVPTRLSAADPSRRRAIDALFGGCLPVAASNAAGIAVAFAVAAPETPDRAPDVEYSEVRLWFTPGGLGCRHVSGLVAERHGDLITVGGDADERDLDRSFRRAVQPALIDALAERGRHSLHAAALVRDGRAIIAIGSTGAGKSTLSYAAGTSERGWRVLTDDIAWVTLDDDVIEVSGLPKPLQVPDNTLAQPPEGARRLDNDARNRWVLPQELVAHDERVPVIGLLVIQHADSDGHLEPHPSGPGLLAQLVQTHPFSASAERVRAFFPVAGALSRLPVLVLRHDADPSKRVAVAVELLERAWAHFTTSSAQ